MAESLVRLNAPAPDFEAVDLRGRPVRLSDFRGRRHVALVLTNRFACMYCRAQLAQLRDAHARFEAANSEVVVVGPDPLPLWQLYFRHQRLMPAVRHHHEQFAGGGYPDGLTGEAIPVAARILALCDAYDALTSTRAYRGAMPRDQALALMRDNARGQWDPELIPLLQAVAERDGEAQARANAVAGDGDTRGALAGGRE